MRRWSLLVGPGLLALAVVLLPVTPTRAQLDPMMGPHLDQLMGDEFDKAFLAQFAAHQATGVMLARPAAEKAGHQETRELAQGIVMDQSKEIAQLQAWARDWYGIEIAGPPAVMGEMDQDMMGTPGVAEHPMTEGSSGMAAPSSEMAPPSGMQAGGMMTPGQGMGSQPSGATGTADMAPHAMGDMPMATDPSMVSMPMSPDALMTNSLAMLPPNRLDVAFLSLMIQHQQDTVELAKLAADRAAHPELKELAQHVVQSQGSQIMQMDGWLGSWYSL
jgi:uncharacterized protein (DUF305 family)